jgi:hypothetical protein
MQIAVSGSPLLPLPMACTIAANSPETYKHQIQTIITISHNHPNNTPQKKNNQQRLIQKKFFLPTNTNGRGRFTWYRVGWSARGSSRSCLRGQDFAQVYGTIVVTILAPARTQGAEKNVQLVGCRRVSKSNFTSSMHFRQLLLHFFGHGASRCWHRMRSSLQSLQTASLYV